MPELPPAKILTLPAQRLRPARAANAPAPPSPPNPERKARLVLIGLLVAAGGLFFVAQVVGTVQETTAVQQLATESRLQLYRHAMSEVGTICLEPAAASGIVRQHCAAQADLLLVLPECTEPCRRAAALVVPRARR